VGCAVLQQDRLVKSNPPQAPLILQVRARASAQGQSAWLRRRVGDIVPELMPWSRRAARVAERIATDRPGLSVGSMIAELGDDRVRRIPASLVERLAYALHRALEAHTGAAPADAAASLQPQPVPGEAARVLVARLQQLQQQLQQAAHAAGLIPLSPPRQARVLLEEKLARFFYTEETSSVPAGIALAIHDRPFGFVAVRGEMLDPRRQSYAIDRILDILLDPVGDERAQVERMLRPLGQPLLDALDALQRTQEHVQWRVTHSDKADAPTLKAHGADGLALRHDSRKRTGWQEALKTHPHATQADLNLAVALDAQGHARVVPAVFAYLHEVHIANAHGNAMALRTLPLQLRLDDDGFVRLASLGQVWTAQWCAQVMEQGGLAVVHQDALCLLRTTPAQRTLLEAITRLQEPLTSPQQTEVANRLRAMAANSPVEVVLGKHARGLARQADDSVIVKASHGDAGVDISVMALPAGIAFPVVPGQGQATLYADGFHVERSFAEERMRASEVVAALQLPHDHDGSSYARFASSTTAAVEALLRVQGWPGVHIAWGTRPVGAAVKHASMRFVPTSSPDHLGVEGSVELVGAEVLALQPILDALRLGHRFAIVDDVAVLMPDGLAEALQPVAAHQQANASVPAVVARLHQFDASTYVKMSETTPPVDMAPADIRAVLRPYQVQGVRFLLERASAGVGAVLADEMGLGKTLQAVAFLAARAHQGPAMVLCPTSLSQHWADELQRFAPQLQVTLLRSGRVLDDATLPPPGHVWVVSYGVLGQGKRTWSESFATLVLDEAHALKNAASQRRKAVARVRSQVCVALTGTPLENHTGELWSLLDLVAPGLFGTEKQFFAHYGAPIDRDNDDVARQRLRAAIQPLMLRRRKRDVAKDLPEKLETIRFVDLEEEEHKTYEDVRKACLHQLSSLAEHTDVDAQTRMQILQALTQLRLVACHPRFLTGSIDDPHMMPASKQRVLLDLVQEVQSNGKHCLVFSQFVRHLRLAQRVLEDAGIRTSYLDGGTPAEERAHVVKQFQQGDGGTAFCISMKAGGVGLNLTRASYVFHLDPWWNPAVEDQATDRAHRIGQLEPVQVVRLLARGTIEESMMEVHERKRSLVNDILAGTDAAANVSLRDMLSMMRVVPASTKRNEA
jgi:superfamily II DNA or RNA helicase